MKKYSLLLIVFINFLSYQTVSAQQVLGNFTTADSFEWPRVTWLRDLDNNWDEGLIKMSANTSGIARQGFGIHLSASRQFTFWSSGLNPLLSIEGGTGNTYIKGKLGVGVIDPATSFEVRQLTSGWTMNSRVIAGAPGEINGLKLYSGYIGDDKWAGIASVAEDLHSNKTGLALYSGMGERLRISGEGNIGINTLSPKEKLAVRGNIGIETTSGIDGTFANIMKYGYYSDLESDNSYSNRWHGIDATITAGSAENNKMKFRIYPGSTLNPQPIDVMVLNGAGNVIIGKSAQTNSVYKLEVSGKIKADEIRVDGAGAPDYVFEPGYKVETLEALESYIKTNKHLPEVPSAKEFERDGIAVGEMNKLLLKKIEELTLYLIDLKKENTGLKQRLEKLETKVVSH